MCCTDLILFYLFREITGKNYDDKQNISGIDNEHSPSEDIPEIGVHSDTDLSTKKKKKIKKEKSSKDKRTKNKTGWKNSRMFKDTDSENEQESEAIGKLVFDDAKEIGNIKKMSDSDDETQNHETSKVKKSKAKRAKNKTHSTSRKNSRITEDTDSENESDTNKASDMSLDEKENKWNLKEKKKYKVTKNKSPSTSHKNSRILKDSDSENESEHEAITEPTFSDRKEMNISDDEKENHEISNRKKSFEDKMTISKSTGRKNSRILKDTDSENESEHEAITEPAFIADKETEDDEMQNNTKGVISIGGSPFETETPNLDSETQHNKRSRILDSDSEEESAHLGKKKKRIILSDDED